MSEQAQAQSQPAININLVQVLDLACRILHQGFFQQPEAKAKTLLKDLKSGKRISVGAMNLNRKDAEGAEQPVMEMPLSLELDYSEFRGPGFGFPAFRAALQGMLNQIGNTMRARRDLNIMSNQQQNTLLVHQPGVVRIGEQFNVMVLGIERGTKNQLTLKLMFIDPEQYPRRDQEAAAVTPDSAEQDQAAG
ncbi:hypothetical protein [Pseudomaricurvus sp. HS19]|uniref:hypothetical protein n=1 Tax=Pseudomaricurvus sp. HS19 TaxID=2692626 RepID=UPI00136EF97F|nr:hypothetical protein [Pseudomaricurvus sp. HS19]MYM64507.1 hypothetical protein [Pseudomaricurvus sp. HS19]